MQTLTTQILESLESNRPVVLATIISRNGSAPRGTGAAMIIHADGTIAGTIGGGQLEAKAITLAAQVHKDHTAAIQTIHMTGKDAAASDMICGGTQEVLVEYLNPADAQMQAVFKAAADCARARRHGWMLVLLPDTPATRVSRWFIQATGEVVSCGPEAAAIPVQVSADPSAGPDQGRVSLLLEVEKALHHIDPPGEPQILSISSRRFYIEPLQHYGTVYIFGAGHVSRFLAPLTALVGFRTVVLDDRADYANAARFPEADEVIVLRDNETAFSQFSPDPESYIVIVTRGHLHDHTILRQALRVPAVYTGMIGSKRKREEIYRALEEEGVARAELEKVYSPIGLPIGAESPEEIAVSIVAELVQVRARHLANQPVTP